MVDTRGDPLMKRILFGGFTIVLIILASCSLIACSMLPQAKAAEYYELAEGYADLSKYDKAINYYKKAGQRKEYVNASNYGLARMYAFSAKWDEASKLFSDLYKQDPESTMIASAYAYSLASSGQYDKALSLYDSLYQKNNDDPVLARNYAEMLFISKKYEETLAQITLMKEKFPDTDALKGIDALEKKVNDAINPAPVEEKTPESKTDTVTNTDTSGNKPPETAPKT